MHQLYMAYKVFIYRFTKVIWQKPPTSSGTFSNIPISIPQIFRHLTPGAARTARPERLVVAPKLWYFFLIGNTPPLLLKIVIWLNFFKWCFGLQGNKFGGKLWRHWRKHTLTLWMLKNSAVLGVPNEQWSVDPDWLACIYKGVLL